MWCLASVLCLTAIAYADAEVPTGDSDLESDAASVQPTAPAVPPQSSTAAALPTPEQLIAEHLTIGRALLKRGDFADAQVEFRGVLQIDATHRGALQLMTQAQQELDARRRSAEREQGRLRGQAIDVALQFAREKANERTKADAQARAQLTHGSAGSASASARAPAGSRASAGAAAAGRAARW